MKTKTVRLSLVTLLTTAAAIGLTAAAQPADPGWPRVFKQDKKQLTVYQPQVDYWRGYTNIHFRCAIAVKGVTKQEKFGVAEIDAVTVTDQADRIVALVPTQRDIRFPNCSADELAALRGVVDALRPPGQAMTISLDRVIAYLNPDQHPTQPPVAVNLDPPRIFYSRQPAILVIFLGEPQFKPVETNRTDLLFALNTNWDVLYDTASQRYYLLNGDNWLTAPDVKGPWTAALNLPRLLATLPAYDHWAAVRANLPGKPAKVVPVVYVSPQPAELIITQGDPSYSPIPGTRLFRVVDTDSILFRDTGAEKFYFLVAGRWFRAADLEGPWSAASRDLPADFAQIPDNDPMAFVKAAVPGTRQAQDAVLLASIPTTTTVNLTNATVNVTYSGAPQFVVITNTVIQYAVNTPKQVFLVGNGYYCCDQGVWFCGASAMGPWTFCTSVPSVIYTIPPSSPNYNVTYVLVQSSTPTTVTYSQTSGYSGEYVAATGVLMFGAGMLAGAAIANNNSYYYPPPCHYSYGCGATYHYGYGGYYGASSTAYGPYGSASHAAAYNPYTGTSAASRSVSTPYGTASQGAAYNPYTGARAAGESVSTAYGSASRGAAYNPTTGNAAWGGSRSSAYGSASAVQTSSGAGAATWNTANSQGTVAKTSSGNVYASNGDSVYKKDSNGSWSQNSGSGWQTVQSPQQQAQTQASSYQQSAQSQASSYQQQAQSKSSSSQQQAQSQASSRQQQAQSQASTANSSASSKQAQAQSQAGSYQQQRSSSGSASSASSSWSQNKQSMESQDQSRSWGNQQHQSSQSWQSSGGHSSGSSSYSRSSGGSRSGGGRR
ncbi:MAG: hypothetical protein WCK27_13000 [Verrucomicrobiota bacterium]